MKLRHDSPYPFLRRDSLRLRILAALTLSFLGLLTTAILALDWNLRHSLDLAQSNVLQAQLLGLVAAAEYDPDRENLWIPEATDRRLFIPGSDLVAEIRSLSGESIWRSGSAIGLDIQPPGDIPRGTMLDWTQSLLQGRQFVFRAVHIDWEHAGQTVGSFWFIVGQDLAPWQTQYRSFRFGLVSSFMLIAVLTLFLLGLFLRSVLDPLKRIEQEIHAIEDGRRESLSVTWPAELQRLVNTLNMLLERETARQKRYQEALANLAHSLKTPLAAARHLLRGPQSNPQGLDNELIRMDRIIAWHLRRVATPSALRPSEEKKTSVLDVCHDLVASLEKVYAHKSVRCTVSLEQDLYFHADPDDLYEILGNLLDNAFKFAETQVHIERLPESIAGLLGLRIEDDGPGTALDQAPLALQRMQRLDEQQPGQGIGLTTVHEILLAYGGDLHIRRATWGGWAVEIRLPRKVLDA